MISLNCAWVFWLLGSSYVLFIPNGLGFSKIISTLKALNFAIFAIFDHYHEMLYHKNFQNHKIAKLNTAEFEILFFLMFWSKYDIDTRMSHISTYGDEIRVSVTYLITITLINNEKTDTRWDFRFLFSMKSRD